MDRQKAKRIRIWTRLLGTLAIAWLLVIVFCLALAASAQAKLISPNAADQPSAQRMPQSATTGITLDVPILMYHQVGSYPGRYNVPRQVFEAQMAYLAQNGYTSVSIDQIAAALRGQGGLPPCPVAITFDAGYTSVYSNAVPILQQYGRYATFYIVAGYIGMSRRFMNWNQVRDLATDGMWIGSHSYNHPYLARLFRASLEHQIVDSKAKLESELGISVTTFAYPFGSYSPAVMHAVTETGYVAALWTGYGSHQAEDRIYKMPRYAIYNWVSLRLFEAQLPKHRPNGSGACSSMPQP